MGPDYTAAGGITRTPHHQRVHSALQLLGARSGAGYLWVSFQRDSPTVGRIRADERARTRSCIRGCQSQQTLNSPIGLCVWSQYHSSRCASRSLLRELERRCGDNKGDGLWLKQGVVSKPFWRNIHACQGVQRKALPYGAWCACGAGSWARLPGHRR